MLDVYPVHQGAYIKNEVHRDTTRAQMMDIVRKITLIWFWA